MDPINKETAVVVRDLAVAAMAPKQVTGFQPVYLVPDGYHPGKFTPNHEAALPGFIDQRVLLDELDSFVSYVKQFKTPTSRIFAIAGDNGAKVAAVLDYHGASGVAGRVAHQVTYEPLFSSEFEAWRTVHGKPLTQDQFLDHLRKWGDTITSHTDADLIELASSLDFTFAGAFSSHVERVKGGRKLLFNETVEGSAQLKGKAVTVPDGIALRLPVFNGGREYEMAADILYRPQAGQLRITIELRRPHLVIRNAVKDIVEDVKTGTEIQPFIGKLL